MSQDQFQLDRETWVELVRASSAINSSLDLQHVLKTIAQSAANVASAEAGSVLTLDKRSNKLVFVAASGPVGEELLGQEFDADLGIAGRVLSHGKPEIVRDAHSDPEFLEDIDRKSEFVTQEILAAPMVFKGETIGVVEVLNCRNGSFGDVHVEILKVFADLAAVGVLNAQAHQRLQRENEGLRKGAALRDEGMIGRSERLREVQKLCDRVAPSNATVLILGETGTGKELTARHIHLASNRAEKPFIGINCAALAETLLESELFGHEKGAFTGAVGRKIGRFELADGGSLFLDEIGDISQSTQVKLLRVLQEREVVRVGGTKTVTCDVRIISATNRNLPKAIKDGSFREDLYYRLNVFPIQLPPLRDRREDIPLLVNHFVGVSARQLGAELPQVSADAMALLTSHSWPGNIRELQNVIERMVLMCDGGELLPMHVPREIAGASHELQEPDGSGPTGLRGYERAMIIQALNENGWNQTQAAKSLGISRDNLRYRAKKYRIAKP